MHKLILLVRRLRGIPFFTVSTRALVVLLMLVGAWVATRTLNFPETIELNDKLKHFVVFFCFALLMDLAISRHPFWLWKGLPLLTYGAMIEIMQYFSPERSFSLFDWMADVFGILLYFLIKELLLRRESIRSINGQE